MKKIFLIILFTILSGCAYAQTIPTASPLFNSYSCNGVTTQFPYQFYINATSDMVVYLTDSSGNITTPSSFSVDTTNVWVNYPLVGSPCATGYTVTLVASTPITQTTAYGNRNPFTATAVGSSLNKLTIIDQQLQGQMNRALLVPVSQSGQNFPTPVAGNFIGWNASGQLANLVNPSLTAQWSLSGSNIYYNIGNVGVGKIPGVALDVQGTTQSTAFSGPLTGNITGNVSGTAATVTTAAQPAITSVGTLTGLLTSGNIGISTDSSLPLKINAVSGGTIIYELGSGTSTTYNTIVSNGGDYTTGVENSSGNGILGSGLPYTAFLVSGNSTPLQLGTNDQVRLTIDTGGNVGIGTIRPDGKFSVGGSCVGHAGTVSCFSTNNGAMGYCSGSVSGTGCTCTAC